MSVVGVRGGLARRAFLRAAVGAAPRWRGGVLHRSGAPAASHADIAEPSPTAPATLPTGELAHAGSGRPQVALTFHGAGDLDLPRRVLTLLHDRGASVTVLAVGTWLQQYPDAARLVTDLGHELGNHTWSPPNLAALDEPSVRTEIERCRDRIAAATGGQGAFFRPSQAQHATPVVLCAAAAAGYPRVLSYDVDSRDFADPGSAAVRRAVRSVTAGGVVSLHFGHPGTAEALPGLLDDLARSGCDPGHGRNPVLLRGGPVSVGLAAARLATAVVLLLATACSAPSSTAAVPPPPTSTPAAPAPAVDVLPGMPPVTDTRNVYAAAGAGMLTPAAASAKPLVYVPHTKSHDVWVIDPATFAVVARYPLGGELQHVVPSWDLQTLYASDDKGNRLTPFDPVTGAPGAPIPVIDPYNLYFTPDGRSAISVAEERRELVFYDPRTWAVQDTLPTPDCAGVDHADFTPDGRTAVFTCEFAGRVAVVDVAAHRLLRVIDMPRRNTMMGPQDIKLAPDGSVFYIADSDQNGLWVLDGAATAVVREIPTGHGAHGLYLSRDAARLYVTNRLEGSVSVLDAYTGAPVAKWTIPGGGSPDMGNVTADGTQLWLSGRYDRAVYVLSTADGHLIRKIDVGNGPHGLCVWPQPGRYSLGHTGITR